MKTPIRDMLTAIPDLAVEAEMTRYAPNPDGRSGRSARGYGSRPPLNLDALDVLRETDGETWQTGLLFGLAQAVRICWDAVRREDSSSALPAPAETPTWTGECGWLLATMDLWQACVDSAEWGLVDGYVRAAYGELRRFTRQPRPLRLRCHVPSCMGQIEPTMVDGRMHAEQCTEGHFVDRHAAARRIAESAELPLSEISNLVMVPLGTLREWASPRRGRPRLLNPASKRADGVRLYRVDDARELVLMMARHAYRAR